MGHPFGKTRVLTIIPKFILINLLKKDIVLRITDKHGKGDHKLIKHGDGNMTTMDIDKHGFFSFRLASKTE